MLIDETSGVKKLHRVFKKFIQEFIKVFKEISLDTNAKNTSIIHIAVPTLL